MCCDGFYTHRRGIGASPKVEENGDRILENGQEIDVLKIWMETKEENI